MENQQTPTESVYKNQLIFEKCYDTLVKTTSDIQFIFQTETDEIKISANKAVLAAASPVFHIMFFGDLKEEGDVKIVDVSADAFREFLQFFYDYRVKLSMDNISDVLTLIDKYDVANGAAVCIKFLKDHLTIDDILWGLHLSIKFRLPELKNFCKKQIESNYKTVSDKINFNDDGRISASDDQISGIDWDAVLPHVFMASKNVVRDISEQLENKPAIYFVTVASAELSYRTMVNDETVVFTLDNPMMLTDIICSNVYSVYQKATEHSFRMTIERKPDVSAWYSDLVYETEVNIDTGKNCVKLTTPILIDAHYVYAINFRYHKQEFETFYTNQSVVVNLEVELAPNVNIRFIGDSEKSLVARMYFTHLTARDPVPDCA